MISTSRDQYELVIELDRQAEDCRGRHFNNSTRLTLTGGS